MICGETHMCVIFMEMFGCGQTVLLLVILFFIIWFQIHYLLHCYALRFLLSGILESGLSRFLHAAVTNESCCMITLRVKIKKIELYSPPQKRPTKRAPDAGESARFRSIFLASGFFYISNRIHVRPSAGNANRWAANPQIINYEF